MVNTDVELRVPAGENQVAEFAQVVGPSLGIPPERALTWVRDKVGREKLRVVQHEGRVVAGLGTIWMGQWFGGRSVPLVGVNAVAVAPERRASGVGTAMMRALLRELRAKGVALSGLYPATYPVYRRVGYESAGTYTQFALDPGTLGVRDAGLSVRPAGEADRETVRALYNDRARQCPGNLDRDAFMWERVFAPGGSPASVYLVERGPREEPQGYLAFTQASASSGGRLEITVRDLVALTPAAGLRLLSFLGEHRSMVRRAVLSVAPNDPLLLQLPEEPQEVVRFWHWMLRVVDVRAALAARGYPAGCNAEVHFVLRDEVLPENAGNWVLEVAGGEGRVHEGGRGEVSLDARALAAVYSGHVSPVALRRAGMLAGADEALACAEAVFAGPAPWMPDFY